jgi:DNA processing protein
MALPGKWSTEDILGLSLLKNLSSKSLRFLVTNYSSPDEALYSINNNELKAIFSQDEIFNPKEIINYKLVEEQFNFSEKFGGKIISFWDENYPPLLKEIEYPPVILFVLGELYPENIPIISIVGTRHCSTYGKLAAEKFAKYFSKKGIIICSGLAYGIDTISHLSVVETKGITYSVIASGLDLISPSTSMKNANKIIETGGAVISEYPYGTVARPAYFPQRNRIISGMAKALLVIESGIRGGSLITAHFAFDQGREVFAVPGEISSDKSKGTNMLIKKNIASIAISPEDMLMELGLDESELKLISDQKPKYSLNPQEEIILKHLNNKPKQIDDIVRETGLSSQEVLVLLLNMEFMGIIRQLPGKHYIKDI